MELSKDAIYTAQDLLEFLQTIPPAVRERLPIQVIANDGMDLFEAPFDVEAFEITETEGCIERALRLSTPESDD